MLNSKNLKNKKHWRGSEIREHSYPDEKTNIGIDFDGVIHRNSKGFYDGTVYDEPILGSYEALQEISKNYTVIVYSAKARSDRGLINGKTGIQLIWEWLEKHNMSQFVSKVTAEKPRAVCYIDDKAYRFKKWESCLEELKHDKILKE